MPWVCGRGWSRCCSCIQTDHWEALYGLVTPDRYFLQFYEKYPKNPPFLFLAALSVSVLTESNDATKAIISSPSAFLPGPYSSGSAFTSFIYASVSTSRFAVNFCSDALRRILSFCCISSLRSWSCCCNNEFVRSSSARSVSSF